MHEEPLGVLADTPNPFETGIVRDLWNEPPDLPAINAELTQTILADLDRVVTTGDSRGAVVLGDAGAGKTHLLTRLRGSPAVQERAFVVDVPPLVGRVEEFPHHLLHNLVLSLQRGTDHRDMQQLRRLLVSFVKTVVPGLERGRLELPRSEYRRLERQARAALMREAPRAHPDVIRILGTYLAGGEGEDVACDWLRGHQLDPEDLELLGMEHSLRGGDEELAVLEAITAMARLGEPKRAILFCFDQIDAYTGNQRLLRFAEMVTELVHRRNHLCLTMCLRSTWQELEGNVPMPLLDRVCMSSRVPYELRGLPRDQVRELLAARLAIVVPAGRPDALYPLTEEDVTSIQELAGVPRSNPRRVIFEASRLFEERRSQPPSARAGASLTDLIRERLGAAPPPPIDEQQTRGHALAALQQQGIPAREATRQEIAAGIHLVVEAATPAASQAIAFVGGGDARSYGPRLRRLIRLADDGGVGRVIVIRDRREPISERAPETQRAVDEILAHPRMRLVWLDERALAELKAARDLDSAAAAGDLAYSSGSQQLTATPAQVADELRAQGLLAHHPLLAIVLADVEDDVRPDAATAPAISGCGQRILELLAERPILDLERIQASIDGVEEAELERTLEVLAGDSLLHLHRFQGRLQVRRV